MFRLTLCALATAALAACSSTPIEPAQAPVASAAPASTARAQHTPPSTSASQITTVNLDPLDDPKNTLAARSVYFHFDDFAIEDKYLPLVQAHGQYVAAHTKAHIRVEGNADERGSREYNLALGDKRAHIVAHQLELLGASSAQIDVVSYGEERPKSSGHDEAAWSENRRADILYVTR